MSDSTQELGAQQLVSEGVPSINASSVGRRLAHERELRGWTVQYVAEQLKLSQSQILALESDQFDKLPKMVIVRGFVRAYAKLLRVDATELMSLMPLDSDAVALETSLRPALATPFIEPRMTLTGHHQEHNRRYVIGILILLVLVLMTLIVQRTEVGQRLTAKLVGEKLEDKGEASVAKIEDVSSISASSTPPTSEQVASNLIAGPASTPAIDLAASVASVGASTASAAMLPEAPVANVPAEADKVSSSTSTTSNGNASSDKLVLKFKHDSWLFVRLSGGAVVTSRMVRAGSEESFEVKQGLFVKIGNALDVEASLRGAPLAITMERDSRVATLNVK